MDKKTRIKVKTIGYYHRDRNMKVNVDRLPRNLNENKKYINNENGCPHVELDIPVEDSGAGEDLLESLLEYIRIRPWKENRKPDFVTNKNLLKIIASTDYDNIEVHAVRMNGVIFMMKKKLDRNYNTNFGAVFEHFLTKESENEKIGGDGTVRKAVFTASVPLENDEGRFKLMYSGEIDAIDETQNNKHYELKVQRHGISFFFYEYQGCIAYWQAIFSDVPTIIVGSRTGNSTDRYTMEQNNVPINTLYEIKSIEAEDIPRRTWEAICHPKNSLYAKKERKSNWTIKECEKKIERFLRMIYENVRKDGDCVVFSKLGKEEEWILKEDEETVRPFFELVKKCLNLVEDTSELESKTERIGMNADSPTASIVSILDGTPAKSSNEEYILPTLPNCQIPFAYFDFPTTPDHSKTATYIENNLKQSRNGSVQPEHIIACNPLSDTLGNDQKQDSQVRATHQSTNIAHVPPNPSETDQLLKECNAQTVTNSLTDSTIPGMIQTQPKSKIVFNAPYDEQQNVRFKINNPSSHRIGFVIKVRKTRSKKISVNPNSGVLKPNAAVMLTVNCDSFDSEMENSSKDRIIIEWMNILSDEEFNLEQLESDGLFRRKTLFIEYND